MQMKKNKMWTQNFLQTVRKNAPVLLVVLLGVLLLLLPRGSRSSQTADDAQTAESTASFSVQMQEQRLADILTQMEGAGKVSVFLSVGSTGETVYAANTQTESSTDESGEIQQSSDTEYITVRTGSSSEQPVEIKTVYPDYIGAVVAAQGADNATVQLALTEAVSAATGLGADKIMIVKMK